MLDSVLHLKRIIAINWVRLSKTEIYSTSLTISPSYFRGSNFAISKKVNLAHKPNLGYAKKLTWLKANEFKFRLHISIALMDI